jgi:hypothetical protein
MSEVIPAYALHAGDRILVSQSGAPGAPVVAVVRVIETGPCGSLAHLDGIAEPVSYGGGDMVERHSEAGWAS